MIPVHKEVHLEDQIEECLLKKGGYLPGDREEFDPTNVSFSQTKSSAS